MEADKQNGPEHIKNGDRETRERGGSGDSGPINMDPHHVRGELRMLQTALERNYDVPEEWLKAAPQVCMEIIGKKRKPEPNEDPKHTDLYVFGPFARLRAVNVLHALEKYNAAKALVAQQQTQGTITGAGDMQTALREAEARRVRVIDDQAIDEMFQRLPPPDKPADDQVIDERPNDEALQG